MSKWSSAFRDSRWQKLRLEIMERDNWTCRSCGKKDGVTLNVHHAYYEAGKAPWEYPKQTLITYCEECHKERHELQKMLLINVSLIKTSSIEGLVFASTDYENALEILSISHVAGMDDEEVSSAIRNATRNFILNQKESYKTQVKK